MRLRWMAVCGVAAVVAAGVGIAAAQGPKEIKVAIADAKGADVGSATLKTVKSGVQVKIALKGLAAGPHGVHIHQKPLCEGPAFTTAGGHFNPDGKKHGYQNPMGHHNGDMPDNINVGTDGKGSATFVLTSISLDPTVANSVLANGGTSIVVHEKADDEMTDPSGASGSRIACGVIKN
jgi:Cu-Zn family superoxide dismutase